ncbi:S-adenosyl-L-methionine-dependent methyltransferase [Linnemannia elongata AG-77]|uniref:S-adenosyl-L-methionine-dependent methyltransferase n=1 Tax=Linnemannia elongata AG-77 TaxID=1314771 RepID=A0A197JK05_9FUNG|nr:S-adenosyl-L-methionine-dependent methyltransferase [Linnemannia elongata AG-77]
MPAQTVKSMVDYNNKATIQCKVAANLLKYIIEAARNLPPLSSDQCVRVLENACSHGVNSVDFALAVCQAAANRDPSATVSFIFNDLPDNDFDEVLALVSNSTVADFNPTLHTLGKSMYSPLTKPGTLDLVYSNASLHWLSSPPWLAGEGHSPSKVANQAREDFAAYVSSRHQELRQGGKLAVSFPGVPDGQSGMNSCFPDDFKRVHEIVAERGAASLAWMQKYCNGPTYSRDRAEVLQDIEELGASDYRAGRITLDDIATRTADMLSSVFHSTFTSMWVQYGGLKKDQAEDLMDVFSEALHQALKEPKTLRVYHLWVIVATKK